MANCGNCNIELKSMNTPIFGVGKLASGETLCTKCHAEIIKINRGINLKKSTLTQIQDLFQGKEKSKSRIEEQLLKINNSHLEAYRGKREVKELETILASDEELFAIVSGTYNNGNGILVATNKRLIFIDKGILYGLKVEDFGLDKISSIQYETGLLLASIKIMASGNIAEIKNIQKLNARDFSEKVRLKLAEPKKQDQILQVTQNNQVDIADQLTKLANLKNQGILTQEEFDQQKQKLLSL